MTREEGVPLSALTTFKVGGPARFVYTCTSVEDVIETTSFAQRQGLPLFVLGEGSNLLAQDDGFPGVVLRMRMAGRTKEEVDGDSVVIECGAGESWDELVSYAAEQSLWGIENLAGIPGTLGAAPVQNIGAYGTELETVFESVTVFDTNDGSVRTMSKDMCAFSYRESVFKRSPHLIILSIRLRLTKKGSPQLMYGDLARLVAEGESLDTPTAIAHAVRGIRAKKFPDLRRFGTAGSFFKNPILSLAAYEGVAARYQDVIDRSGPIPRYPRAEEGTVKIPLAYVLDKILGLRGYRVGSVGLFENQPLVVVAYEGATANAIDAFANEIAHRVEEATNISIEREVRAM